jgi:hypothetical protein
LRIKIRTLRLALEKKEINQRIKMKIRIFQVFRESLAVISHYFIPQVTICRNFTERPITIEQHLLAIDFKIWG